MSTVSMSSKRKADPPIQSSRGNKITVNQSFVSTVENGRVFDVVNIEAANEVEMCEIEAVASLARSA